LTDDTVYAYSASKGGTLLGSAVESDGTATITLDPGKLSSAGGRVYISVKSVGANESPRTAVTYTSEKSTVLTNASVAVTNNYYSEQTAYRRWNGRYHRHFGGRDRRRYIYLQDLVG
jgi:hypothetical protein